MEIAIIGSDIQEVLGSAIGLQILFGIPLWVGCLLTGTLTQRMLACTGGWVWGAYRRTLDIFRGTIL